MSTDVAYTYQNLRRNNSVNTKQETHQEMR